MGQYITLVEDFNFEDEVLLELCQQEIIEEAEYKGKKVQLNKPQRGGSKKFYVYVKNQKGM
jgi:hypothetical protein